MVPRLIAVLRQPRAVLALLSERTGPLSSDAAALPVPYRERRVPLADVSEAICPWRDRDVRAWTALGRVPNPSRRASLATLRALIATVADPAAQVGELPPLDFSRPPVDLRPYLCSPRHEQDLIDAIADVLEDATRDLEFPDWHWTRRDRIADMPAGFRTHFLWGLHLSPWSQVELTRAVYDDFDLGGETALRSAIARLLSLADREDGLWWCDALAETPAPHRVRAAELVLESGGSRTRPDRSVRDALAATDWPQATRMLLEIVGAARASA